MSSRLSILAAVALALPLLAPEARAGGGRVLLRLDEALALAFPDCEIERSTVYLTEEQREEIEELAGSKLPSAIVHPYVARKDGAVVGTAYVETHRVRTLRESLFVVVDPRQRVGRIEVLAFAEPEEYLAKTAWYGQFVGRPLDDELRIKRGIRGITGATLTARATTAAVRRVLAAHRVLAAPPVPPPEQ